MVSASFAENTITMELIGKGELAPTSENFAAIVLLPLAMRAGQDILIAGRGDPLLAQNLSSLSRIWQRWLPAVFSEIKVQFDADSTLGRSGRGLRDDSDLVLFSGGVDSTYNLLDRSTKGLTQDLVTIHGMDYKLDDTERFQRLVNKTSRFASKVCGTRHLVRSDAYKVYKKHRISGAFSHIYVLASSLFLFESKYRNAEIAADASRIDEYAIWPWGTNSLTNPLIAGSAYRLATADLDMDRVQKMELLASDQDALSSLSVCKVRSVRPDNCGVCTKCLRTKVHFEAAVGFIPKIFIDNRKINRADLDLLYRQGPHEHIFLQQAYGLVKEKGHEIPGLAETIERLRAGPRRGRVLRKLTDAIKKTMKR
jgi:hypothetical protein